MMRTIIFAAELLILATAESATAVEFDRNAARGGLDNQTIESVVNLIKRVGYRCDTLSLISYMSGGVNHTYAVICNDWETDFTVSDWRGTGEWVVCPHANWGLCAEDAAYGRLQIFR